MMQTDFLSSFESQVAFFKKCHWCDHRRSQSMKSRKCKKCWNVFSPLLDEHFEKARENTGLIKKALLLFRKDLHKMFVESRDSRDDFIAWGQLPLALAARRWDESKGKFSTYAMRAMRNHLNRDYPLGTVGVGENDKVNLKQIKARKAAKIETVVLQNGFDALVKSRVAVNVDEAIELASRQIDSPMSQVVVNSRLRMFQERFPKFWKYDKVVGA